MTLGLLFWLEKAFVFFEFAGVDLYQHRGHWGFRSIYIYTYNLYSIYMICIYIYFYIYM